MPWFRSPKILDDRVKSGAAWETAGKGEKVEYSQQVYEAISNRVMGAFFGIACEIVESGISNIADLDLGVENGTGHDCSFSNDEPGWNKEVS